MNIYEVLRDNVEVKKYRLHPNAFSDDMRNAIDTDEEKKMFDLIKDISTLFFKISNDGVEFRPAFVFEGKRSFAIEDLKEEDYVLLARIDLASLPLNLRSRIADLLWSQKRNFTAAIAAVKAYFELFNLWFSDDDWIEALNMIKRAICISTQIKANDLYDNCCQTIYDHIVRLDGKDKHFLSISLIEILVVQNFNDLNNILKALDKVISSSKENPEKMKRAHSLKFQCLNKMKNAELAMQTNIELAEYLVSFAEDILKNDEMGALRAQCFYQEAIIIYRNNGEPGEAEIAHKRLVEIQKEIPKLMKPIGLSFDAKKITENITENMKNLTFEECVIKFSQMITFYKKDECKQMVIDDISSYPMNSLFPKRKLNKDGQTILTLPPLNGSNPEEKEDVLELHIHNKMLELQEIAGNMYLRFALSYIKNNFDVEKESFDFLIEDNIIIPKDRMGIIRSALCMVFQGKCYEALHILAPQVENIFRNIAKEVGGLTVTLDNDGSSKEKVLSSIFDLPELMDCYDNDILFMFKGLLNEQAGANIRNNIAHGIINEYTAFSGACLFFVCAVIKLLVISSAKCIDILISKKEVSTFVNLDSSVLQIQDDASCDE